MSERNGDQDQPLIEVRDLVKHFPVRGGVLQRTIGHVRAVDGVSFSIMPGETLGLVGESGCGKTTVGRTVLQLIKATSGEVLFEGKDILKLGINPLRDLRRYLDPRIRFDLSPLEMFRNPLKPIRREMQIIFQDPFSSLDPRVPVGDSIAEGLVVHGIGNRHERYQATIEALKRVGLAEYHANRYPHEFSGGQRQRIGVARALVLNPKFIVCDEAVSALDVSIQAQVLNLLDDLQREFGLTYLFISHDLSVVEHISDRVAVMYLGKIVELASRDDLFGSPMHPYTQALMSAIPIPNPKMRRERIILQGDVPSPVNPPGGCRFHTRCPVAMPRCSQEEPPLKDYGNGHFAACWDVDEKRS